MSLFSCFVLQLMLLFSPMMTSNSIIIEAPVDLKGEVFTIPQGKKLVFRGRGCILNGVIQGNDTYVIANRKAIFKNVILKGTFDAEKAYSEWFDIKDDCILDKEKRFVTGTDNTQCFRNLFLFKNVVIKMGNYLVKGTLRCIDNQTIEGNNATIKHLNKSMLIWIEGTTDKPVRNIHIKDLHIIGGKNEYEDKTEFWHGIKIDYATDVLIENVISELCRGDGFCIGTPKHNNSDIRIPERIIFNNVSSLHNHRQGLSIGRAKNVKVLNSEFSYSKGTAPQEGIDIEPNQFILTDGSLVSGECEDILISNCVFRNNTTHGIHLCNNYHGTPLIKNVNVKDCKFYDNDILISGSKDCSFSNLYVENSQLLIFGKGAISNLKIYDVCLENNQSQSKKHGVYVADEMDFEQRDNIVIKKITVKGYNGYGIYLEGLKIPIKKHFDYLEVSNCKVINCKYGITAQNSIKNVKKLVMTDNIIVN